MIKKALTALSRFIDYSDCAAFFCPGISVWQCKHADVCTYVRRVLINSRTLLEQVTVGSKSDLTMHSKSALKCVSIEF